MEFLYGPMTQNSTKPQSLLLRPQPMKIPMPALEQLIHSHLQLIHL